MGQNTSDEVIYATPVYPSRGEMDAKTPKGHERLSNLARIASAAGLGEHGGEQFNADDGEATTRALEAATANGTSYDVPVIMLALQQRDRYTPGSGVDNAETLIENIAQMARRAAPGVKKLDYCAIGQGCNNEQITNFDIASVITLKAAKPQHLGANLGLPVNTGTAATMSYIMAYNHPELVTGLNMTPQQYLDAARAANPGVDVVKETRRYIGACVRKDPNDANVDLHNCALQSARAAVFRAALTNGPAPASDNEMITLHLRPQRESQISR